VADIFRHFFMLKIGHRGAAGHSPENTIESFLKAFELGANGIELDVHLTADGEVVVIHDPTVDRTIKNAAGFINDFTITECKKIGIPTLVEVFHILPENAFLNIEIKDAKATKVVAKEIEKFVRLNEISYENVLVSSFNCNVLNEMIALNSNINIGVLVENNLEEAFAFAQQINAYSIHPNYKLLTKEIVDRLINNKLKIFTWTVNSPDDITFVKNIGVHAIISDYPERL
jgi:glycerophosphoryl diester phosphodiesterase